MLSEIFNKIFKIIINFKSIYEGFSDKQLQFYVSDTNTTQLYITKSETLAKSDDTLATEYTLAFKN